MQKHDRDVALVAVFSLVFVVACSTTDPTGTPCEEDANCNLSGGGRCVLADSGNRWCAYPDPDCSGGYRFSDNVGDELGDVCLDAPPVQMATLTVSVVGSGTIASVPTGITCADETCTGTFPIGTEVKLLATATALAFLGWSGQCRGISDCDVTLAADISVGAFFGAPGTALWAKSFGENAYDNAAGVAHDSQDNLIVAGVFRGTIDLGGTLLTSVGNADIYVAKLAAADGSVVWARRYGGDLEDLATAITVDSSDAIYLTGSSNGTPDYGGGPLPAVGGREILVVKLDAAGQYVWAKAYGSTGFDQGTAISVRDGKVAVAGYYAGSNMVVGGISLPNQATDQVVVVRLTTDGTVEWAQSFGGSGNDSANAVQIDGSGNVVIAGKYFSQATFGSLTLQPKGGTDIFLAKLATANGNVLFASGFGSDDDDVANAIALDSANTIFIAGAFKHTINFGVGAMTASSPSNYDAFVAKFSVGGACTWSKAFGGAGNGRRASVLSTNAAGDIVVAGSFNGELSLGGATLSSVTGIGNDVFAARLSGLNGAHMTSMRAGGQGNELPFAVVQTTDSKYFVTGAFDGFADFGGTALTAVGGSDAFVFGMAPL